MSEETYRLRDELAWRKMKDGTVTIVSPVIEKIVSINETAGMVWELLDGNHTVAQIADELYQRFASENSINRSQVLNDVNDIIAEFRQRQFIERVDNL